MTKSITLNSLDAIQMVAFASHGDDVSDLTVYQGGDNVPFSIARTFVVRAPGGATRGRHAHKECIQLLVCLNGCVDVVVDDGDEQRSFRLDSPAKGLLIPATLWAEQAYVASENVLMVLCDRGYEPHDYIRDRIEYLTFRKQG